MHVIHKRSCSTRCLERICEFRWRNGFWGMGMNLMFFCNLQNLNLTRIHIRFKVQQTQFIVQYSLYSGYEVFLVFFFFKDIQYPFPFTVKYFLLSRSNFNFTHNIEIQIYWIAFKLLRNPVECFNYLLSFKSLKRPFQCRACCLQ